MDLGIRDRVALVTGGARSLGRADAEILAAEGCRVAVLDLNKEGAEEVARAIAERGGAGRGYECDVRDAQQVAAAVAAVERDLGPVDICVNNAGIIYTLAQLKDTRPEDWELNLAVNLTGAFNVTRAVFPGMRERRWGRIVCMASIAGLLGGFGQTAYATTKMGLVGFARSVALEGARKNITCNAVVLGVFDAGSFYDVAEPFRERIIKRVAMRRSGDPRELSEFIAFLASDEASYITGEAIEVSGGISLFTF